MPHSPKGRTAGALFAKQHLMEGGHGMLKSSKDASDYRKSPGMAFAETDYRKSPGMAFAEERFKGMPSGYEYGSDVGGSPLGSPLGQSGGTGCNLSGRSMRTEISDFLKKLAKDRKLAVQQKNLREDRGAGGSGGKDIIISGSLSKSLPHTRASAGDLGGMKRHQCGTGTGTGFLDGRQHRKRSVTFGQPQPPAFGDINKAHNHPAKESKKNKLRVDTGCGAESESESDATFDGLEVGAETWIDSDRIKKFDFGSEDADAEAVLVVEEEDAREPAHEAKKIRVSTPTRRPSVEERMLIDSADRGRGVVVAGGAGPGVKEILERQVEAELQVEEMTAQSIESFIRCARRAQTAKLSMAEQVIADHFWDRRVEGVKKYASEAGLDIGFACEREDERQRRLALAREGEERRKEAASRKRANVSQQIDEAMRFHGKQIAFRVACANGEKPGGSTAAKARGKDKPRKDANANALLCFDKPQTDFSAYTANPSPRRNRSPDRHDLNTATLGEGEGEGEGGMMNGTLGQSFNDTFVVCESPLGKPGAAKKSSISGLDKVDTEAMLDFKLDLVVDILRKSAYNVVYSGRGLGSRAGADCFNANSTDPARLKLDATGAHYLLSALERAGVLQAWVQPCPDRLAQKGGFPQSKLLEVFGAWGDAKNPALSGPPGVVGLDKAEISTAKDTDRKFEDVLEKIREQSGACLCIGCSLSGAASDEVALASAQDSQGSEFGNLVVINPKPTAQDHKAAVRIWGQPEEILNKLVFKLLFEQRHSGVSLDDMELPNPVHASEAEATHEISERQGRLVEECMHTGNRWSRKFPHCNYHTGDAC